MKLNKTLPGVFLVAVLLCPTHGAAAEKSRIQRIAGTRIVVADLEKTRKFYTGLLGLEEAFDLKNDKGDVTSVFFKVNDEQYLEFATGEVEGFRMEHLAFLTPDLRAAAADLRRQGISPG